MLREQVVNVFQVPCCKDDPLHIQHGIFPHMIYLIVVAIAPAPIVIVGRSA